MSAKADLAESKECLCWAARRAARSITRAFDRALRPHGVRATQFSVLAMLSLRGPTPIGELAKGLGVERTTLTRNLALIEKRGWARVRPGDDARSRVVEVTAKGRAAIETAMPAWRAAQKAATATLGRPGADALRKLAHRS